MATGQQSANADTKGGRRRWQYTMKSLAVFVTVCCLLAALLAALLRPYWEQRRLRDRIQFELNGTAQMSPHGPGWARSAFGDRWFEKVDGVEIDATQWLNADLASLRHSPYVSYVTLWAVQRSEPAALVGLADLPNLSRLELIGWTLTEADLKAIAGLSGLRELTLVGNVTDAGMVHLKALAKLEKLTCVQTAAQLTTAERLAEPTELDFTNCPLKRAVLDYLEDRNNVVFIVDTKGLAEAGFDPENDPVTIKLPSATLRDGLHKVLRPLSLDWTLDVQGIKVSSRAAIERNQPGLTELRQALPGLKEATVDW